MTEDLITLTPKGLYCAAGDFYIDPWEPVDLAMITHAHGDHAHSGSTLYHSSEQSRPIISHRLGAETKIQTHRYGESFSINDAKVSFHSAGHILGSAQVRVEVDGKVWVVSGDYKRDPDPTCNAFEVVPCDAFITEATFALPIYKWQAPTIWAREIFNWWQENRRDGRASLLYCYGLGKSQRILSELLNFTTDRVYLHGAVDSITKIYRDAGIPMLATELLTQDVSKKELSESLVIAPPSANHPSWLKRLGPYESGFASGWMRVRGAKRRRGYDRGFVVSDHADWRSLIRTVKETGAKRVLATHGETEAIVRYLNDQGIAAETLRAKYGDGED